MTRLQNSTPSTLRFISLLVLVCLWMLLSPWTIITTRRNADRQDYPSIVVEALVVVTTTTTTQRRTHRGITTASRSSSTASTKMSFFQQQQQQSSSGNLFFFSSSSSPYSSMTTETTTRLHMAIGKTGGTLVSSADEFDQIVGRRQSQSSNAATAAGGAPPLEEEEKAQGNNNNNKPVLLVFFTAPWCGPCRISVPVVQQVGREYSTCVTVVEVCTDTVPTVAAQAGVVSIPTIQLYSCRSSSSDDDGGDDGGGGRVLRDTIVGCVAKSVLSTAVDKVLEDIAAASSQQQE